MNRVDAQHVSASEFRAACGLFPTGVTVVTRETEAGDAYGMTVSSFTSVSLDPPLILVCIDKRARFVSGLALRTPFAINILREDQQELAVRFATRPETNRFEGVVWGRGWRNTPLLNGAVATLACVLEQLLEAGDHQVLIGAVHEIRRHPGRALVWCESRYHCLPAPAAQS